MANPQSPGSGRTQDRRNQGSQNRRPDDDRKTSDDEQPKRESRVKDAEAKEPVVGGSDVQGPLDGGDKQ